MSKRGPPILTETQWLNLIGTTKIPTDPDAARLEIEECLADYIGLRRPGTADECRAAHADWLQVEKLAGQLGRLLFRIKRSTPLDIQRDVANLKPLRMRAPALVEEYEDLARNARGGRDPANDRLYRRLLGIWTDAFKGRLGVSTAAGRKPYGPLVRFLQQTTAPVLADDTPTPDMIRRIIYREVKRRSCT